MPTFRGDKTQNQWRRWNARVLAVSFLTITGLVAVNVFVDPYLVFGISPLRPWASSNERLNKIQHIVADPGRYDSFLVGSSRMGVFDPSVVERWRPGRRYYNLSAFAADAKDVHLMLEYLRQRGTRIREVILGIDMFPFRSTVRDRDMSQQHHPGVLRESKAKYYATYLFTSSLYQAATKLFYHFDATPRILFNFTGTGHWRLPHDEQWIARDQSDFLHAKFSAKQRPASAVRWVDERFAELGALVAWLDAHGVDLFVFIHPFHHSQRVAITAESFNQFRSRIVEMFPGRVLDLSGWDEITKDDVYYYDAKHYRPAVADEIVRRIFHGGGGESVAMSPPPGKAGR